MKWTVELSEFDITYRPRSAIKGQAVVDFVVEFTGATDINVEMEPTHHPVWTLFVDRFARETGSGAGVLLERPEGHKLNCAIRFGFKTSNNAAEYEVLLAGLRLA